MIASGNTIVKISADNGDIIWRFVTAGRVSFLDVKPAGEDGFLATGFTGVFINGYAARIDADGEAIWEQEYESEDSEVCSGMTLSSAGGWLLTISGAYGADYHPRIIRIDDEDGEIIWQRVYDELELNTGLGPILETSDGGYITVGESRHRPFAFRIDYFGEPVWQTLYGNWQFARGANSLMMMEHGGYVLGGFGDNLGCWLICTTPDPFNPPFELEIEADEHDFGEVAVNNVVDTVGVWELELHNIGRRYVVIDSLWFEGDTSAFACPLDLPFRIDPEDTSLVPVLFRPPADSAYAANLILPYGNEQTLEIALSGRGVVNSALEETNVLYEFALDSPYPNPFNSWARISYRVNGWSFTTLRVFDISGREVDVIYNGLDRPGERTVLWQADGLPSGIYILRLEGENCVRSQKIVLAR